jgi:hypothetical protein
MKKLEKRAAITTTVDVTASVGLAATHTQHIGKHVIASNKFSCECLLFLFLDDYVSTAVPCTDSLETDHPNARHVGLEAGGNDVGYRVYLSFVIRV